MADPTLLLRPLPNNSGWTLELDLPLGTIQIPGDVGDTTSFLRKDGTWAIPSGSGLLYWEEARSVAAPNATVPAHSWTPLGAETDIDAVLRPKGAASIVAAVADNTATGGDKRGAYAVDWQLQRSAAERVAQGAYSVIGGGISNQVGGVSSTSDYSGVLGGTDNKVLGESSSYCFIGGGNHNEINGIAVDYSAICGGNFNTIVNWGATYCFVGGGNFNKIDPGAAGDGACNYSGIASGSNNWIDATADGWAEYCAIGGGSTNKIITTAGEDLSYSGIAAGSENVISGSASLNALHAFIGGGSNNAANATNAAVLGGSKGTARRLGQQAHGMVGNYRVVGATPGVGADVKNLASAQRGQYVLCAWTNSATPSVMCTDNANAISGVVTVPITANQITLPINTSFAFKGVVIARDLTTNVTGPGDTAMFTFEGAIRQLANAAATALVAAVTPTAVCADAGAATWTVGVTADTTIGCVKITVTGEVNKAISWVATVETTELVGPQSGGDAYASNVVLLLRGEGTDGGTTFTDDGPLSFSLNTNSSFTTSTTQAKCGSSSIKGDGGGGRLRYTNTAAGVLSADFTVEGWVYWASTPAASQEIIGFPTTGGGDGPSIYRRPASSNALTFWDGGANRIIGGTAITNNAWHHCALTRSGTTIELWLDGVSQGTHTDGSLALGVNAQDVYIGSYRDGTEVINGWIDNLRITKGVARYTAAFTPPGCY